MRRLKWPKPHQLVLVVGVLVAIGTLVSGIAPRITEWADESTVSREPFIDVPDAVYWAFYVTAGDHALRLRVAGEPAGAQLRARRPDDRRTTKKNLHRRMRDFRAGVWMQTLLRDPAAGVMHSFIYFGFLWLFIATVVLEIDHQLPDNLKFLHGGVYEGYAFAADLAGVVFIVGILWAIGPPLRPAARTASASRPSPRTR